MEFKEFVTFKVGRELYALNIAYVKKIEEKQDIREVPNTSEEVVGIMDFQGEQIVPVVDLRVLFNIKSSKEEKVPRIIISNVNETWIGFVVDEVDEVIEIEDEHISLGNLTETISSESSEYIQGIYRKEEIIADDNKENDGSQKKVEKLLIVLNAEKLIGRKKLQSIKEIGKDAE